MARSTHVFISAMAATLLTAAHAVPPIVDAAPPRREGDSRLDRPVIASIRITPDTVWFCSARNANEYASYFFVRRTYEWRRVARATATPCPPRDPAYEAPTRRVRGADFTVVRMDSTARDDRGRRTGFSYLRVTDDRFNRVTDLVPMLHPGTRRALLTRYGMTADVDFATISAVTATDSVLWIGLAGGFSEGEGAVGGLFRVNRETGTYVLLLVPSVEAATITGLAAAGRWLWVGTKLPGEYGWHAGQGLARLDAPTLIWQGYAPKEDPLPDDLIEALATDGRLLAVATERGVAIASLPEDVNAAVARPYRDEVLKDWERRYFIPTFEHDSLVFDLGTKAEATAAQPEEPRLIFAMRMVPRGRERPLVDALARVPAESLDVWLESPPAYENIGRMVADPQFVPLVLAHAPWDAFWMRFAAGVLGALGANAPEEGRVALHRAFVALDAPARVPNEFEDHRAVLGRALTRVGDSTAVIWARTTLRLAVPRRAKDVGVTVVPQRHGTALAAASSIVATARDRDGLALLISAVPVLDVREQVAAAAALAAYDEPNAWRALVAFARGRYLPLSALRPARLQRGRECGRHPQAASAGRAGCTGAASFDTVRGEDAADLRARSHRCRYAPALPDS
ncbi:MAG: hypothetical protein H3C62_03945 [Gemmatimonadaceae bacterium]|nr:hypothetical protein [Gemmatimonadaceae bacterium]